MKRQFLTQPFGNNAYPPGQPASGTEWSPATDAQSGVPSGLNAAASTYRPGSGLLSGWKSGQVYTADLANQMSQTAMQGPVTGPTLNPGAAHMQASPAAQPFTYQTGMTPEPMQPFHGDGYGYARGNADIQSFSQSSQQQVQMPLAMAAAMVGATASPFQQQSMQPFGMQNMAPTPMSPLAPNPQQVDPFGKPLYPAPGMPQQANGWTQWPRQPAGPYSGYPGYQPPFGPGGPGGGNGGGPTPNFKKRKKRRVPIWARVVLSILIIMLIAVGGGLYYYQINFAQPLSNITNQQVTRYHGDDNPNQGQTTSGSILSGGRFNILLLGSDDDYKSRVINGGVLAQTDIVVSIDPETKSVSMFSIPRDTWLPVPGFGMHKLDQAYLLGGGGAQGAALTMYTLHQDFGIYINHYAWVGLSGFTKVIDTVGGIDVDVIHPITDDSYPDDTGKGALDPYAVKRLYIAPGPQHMNGLTALEYVRSRHADLVGDFGRSVRQQQILNQLKYKLNNPSILGELPALAQDLNGSVKTDMQLQDVYNLMYFAKGLDQNQIQKYTLGPPYSSGQNINTSSGTQDVVILNCNLVQPLIAKVFALGNNAKCDLQGNTGTSTLATSSAPTSMRIAQQSTTKLWTMTDDSLQVEAMNLNIPSGSRDVLGIRSLLDLLFLTVFESPAAFQV